MKQTIKQQWAEALRSREFCQGKERLRSDVGEYDALGVLCELHRRKFSGVWEFYRLRCDGYSYLKQKEYLPDTVMRWAGLDLCDPVVYYQDKECFLTWLGDRGLTFPEIANLIEEQL